MASRKRREFRPVSFLILFAFILTYPPSAPAQQEVPPEFRTDDIRIVSPEDGIIVAPGDTITVVVDVTPGSPFTHIGVIGENIGFSEAKTAPPFEFSLIVPNNVIGPKKLTAVGVISPGNGLFSQSITVNIEKPVAPTSLRASPSAIDFRFAGAQSRINIDGSFADGTSFDITRSAGTIYSSQDIGVATVDPTGLVTAVGPGTTSIDISHDTQSVSVPVSVPQTVTGDLDGDGNVDRDDYNVILDAVTINTQATGPFDARDLNHDGVIDDQDLQLIGQIIGASADLHVTISASPNPVAVGNDVTFTIQVVNNGPDPASNVVVGGTLPALQFLSSSVSQGPQSCPLVNDHVVCRLGTLGNGAGATVTIVATATVLGNITNAAWVLSSIPDPDGSNDAADVVTTVSEGFIPVQIDIKPGSFPNSINPRTKGVIPVAILGTSGFDATTIDPLSVRFGMGGATEIHGRGHIEDVNKDGYRDLVLHFDTQATGIKCSDSSVSLSGKTFGGQSVEGSDSIVTVGCK